MSFALMIAALLTAGCGDSAISPGVQPEIVNQENTFAYQVSDIRNYSGTATYSGQNDGTAVNLNLSTW